MKKHYGYIVPNIIQKQLNSLKKYNSKTKIVFSTEVVNNINDIPGDYTESRLEIGGVNDLEE